MEFGQLTQRGVTAVVENEASGVTPARSNLPKPKGGPKADPWFKNWYRQTKTPESTAHDWWDEFRDANNLAISPGKASSEQQSSFFAWHRAKIRSDAATAKKEAEEAAAAERAEAARRRLATLDAEILSRFTERLALGGRTLAIALGTRLLEMANAAEPEAKPESGDGEAGGAMVDLATA